MYQVIYNELPNNKVPYEFYVKQLGSELWIRIRIRQNDTDPNRIRIHTTAYVDTWGSPSTTRTCRPLNLSQCDAGWAAASEDSRSCTNQKDSFLDEVVDLKACSV